MSSLWQITTPLGRHLTLSTSIRRHYHLPAPSQPLPMHTGIAWCHDCQSFREAEQFPSLPGLQASITRLTLYHNNPGLIPPDLDAITLRSLPDLQARLPWRQARQSPPRCLTCSGTHLLPLQLNHPTIIPPLGPHTLHHLGFLDSSEPQRHFTPEGLELPVHP